MRVVCSCTLDVPRTSRTKVSKTVRIISPHSATSDGGDARPQSIIPPARNTTSPPPAVLTYPQRSDEDILDDPFSAGSDGTAGSTDDEGTRQNTLHNARRSQFDGPESSGLIINPFKRTLATLGTEPKPSQTVTINEERSQGGDSTIPRPNYDVDEFKKLLLTGEKFAHETIVPTVPPVSFQSYQSVGDSSSNTDASSISRQSIFDPSNVNLQESPETSRESSPSDDERQQLVADQGPSLHKVKPSAPRHRHGKLVKANAPQTVSFEDPSLSFSKSLASPKSPLAPNDVHKPLSPLPPLSNPSDEFAQDQEMKESGSCSQATNVQASRTPQTRNPPVPPLVRKHSQQRPKPPTFSGRSVRNTEEDPAEPTPIPQSPGATAFKAPPPPPPPPRRSGGLPRVNSSSSTSTSASLPPIHSQSAIDDISPKPSKTRPPAPPNRSPTISTVKRQPTQIPTGSPTVAPPIPRRRRGSSHSSYTPSGLSGDHRIEANERLRSDSGASSISQFQITSTAPTPNSTESKDVMADLSALQKEVDELRGKFND